MFWLTLALVIVTALYAWLTWRIASSSAAAANASKEAAEHAARAANAAMANLEIDFEVAPRYRFVTSERTHEQMPERQMLNLGVSVRNRGANVWIHGVELEQYYRATKGGIERRLEAEGPGEELLWATTKAPPQLLYRGDDRHFWSPSTWVPRRYVAGLLVAVNYSIDGTELRVRRVSWAGELDDDFEFLGEESKRQERKVDQSSQFSTLTPPGTPRKWT